MALYTIRPNADWNNASAFTITGGSASVHAALADDNDATFISKTSNTIPASYETEFGTQTLGADELVVSVNLRARLSVGTAGQVQFSLGVITDRNGRTVSYSVPITRQNTLALTTIDLALNLTTAPNGQAWSQTTLNNLVARFADNSIVAGDKSNLYELYIDVVTTARPTVSVTAPTGTVTDTTFPSITWTYSDADGDPQSAYEIKIFDSATYNLGGFNPNTSIPEVSTGIVTSTNDGATLVVDLADDTTYRAYVRVAQLVNGQNYFSAFAFSEFTIDVDAPAPPSISAFYDTNIGAITLTIFGRTNVLSANQASLETNTDGWIALTNCSIVRTTAQFSTGVASLQITASASGDCIAGTTLGTAFAVTANSQFSAIADFRAATTSRSVAIGIRFLNASNAEISTFFGTSVTNNNSSWVTATATTTAPALAVKAQVVAKIITAGSSEIHYVDKIAFHSGSLPIWTRGGFSNFSFDVERSLDGTFLVLRGSPIPANSAQIATLNDFEAPLDTTVRYRSKARADI
jgi:hypothetical protein